MGEEFKDFEAEAPVLTLEPDLTDEKEEVIAKEPEKTEEPAIEEPVLSNGKGHEARHGKGHAARHGKGHGARQS